MRIATVNPRENHTLEVVADDGRVGRFDMTPYLELEAFEALKEPANFKKVTNGRYFVEWPNGADLSADTIEARWVAQ